MHGLPRVWLATLCEKSAEAILGKRIALVGKAGVGMRVWCSRHRTTRGALHRVIGMGRSPRDFDTDRLTLTGFRLGDGQIRLSTLLARIGKFPIVKCSLAVRPVGG
jgi:hypothetical protein